VPKVVGLFWNIIKVKKLAMLVIDKVHQFPEAFTHHDEKFIKTVRYNRWKGQICCGA